MTIYFAIFYSIISYESTFFSITQSLRPLTNNIILWLYTGIEIMLLFYICDFIHLIHWNRIKNKIER